MREGDSDQDDAESADADSPRSMAPASAVLPGTVGIAAVASVDLASMTSGSLAALDAGGALDAGADSSQRLRDASLSESQALALEVTSKVDGILAQCSDLDRAVKEVDLGVDEEPLSGVCPSSRVCRCRRYPTCYPSVDVRADSIPGFPHHSLCDGGAV